ncbi:Alpha/Beta hydrolase protein [Ochromonadaceae sp. CCMP2298]|nr:Alpha/Beta hydrolase protein [Ochromonadaceae sp. CCMP2298]|mmetsp:Transcript_4574/g.10000  ORF Transcript_4574/g.10000 Transcript_4574/m.10000 type:complete len:333 (-) Transcript_4574:201-1199(-)
MEEVSQAEPTRVGAGPPPQRYCCGLFGGAAVNNYDFENGPDADFHADSLIKLTHGITAYRIVEPKNIDSRPIAEVPIIVCLHGMYNSSFMWADIADLLTDFEQGPQARVLVLDFYGHGRSPWTGVDITLDTLVTQIKELMDFLELTRTHKPAAFVGFDLGGAVAAGFAAKFPNYCSSLSLISPVGYKFRTVPKKNKLKKILPQLQESAFYDKSEDSPHRYLVDRAMGMVRWQLQHTPGYFGAIESTIKHFPITGMEELFTAIGRHPRPTLNVWGNRDNVCNYKRCMQLTEESFPKGNIVDIADCGHDAPFEKFEDVVKELLTFHLTIFNELK